MFFLLVNTVQMFFLNGVVFATRAGFRKVLKLLDSLLVSLLVVDTMKTAGDDRSDQREDVPRLTRSF